MQYSHHEVVDSSPVAFGQVVSVVDVLVPGLHGFHLVLFFVQTLFHQLIVSEDIEHY